MRVALLGAREAAPALAGALRDRGVEVVTADATRALAPVEAVLRWRAIEPGLTAIPPALRAASGADLAHAFTLATAHAAAGAGTPLVLTFSTPVSRENVAARRLRLKFLKTALEAAAAVTVPDEQIAEGVERWLGVRPRVLDPARDADGFAALYDEVISRR